MHEPSWRKPAGMAIILAIITVVALVVMSQADRIAALPGLVQAVIYVVAGLVWIAPLKPLLRWMETGKWRE